MKAVAYACSFFLILAGIGFAQSAKDNSDTMIVRGCLRRSRQNYQVVDRRGFPYVLKGVGTKLDGDVGREIEVTGRLTDDIKTGTRPEKAGSNPSDTVREVTGATLEVANVASDVHKVSDQCPSR